MAADSSHAYIKSIYAMAYNVRLGFACLNCHDAQLYRDPMNRWLVKIEEHPMAFDLEPSINYQGDSYMGQETIRYQVANEQDNEDKWG